MANKGGVTAKILLAEGTARLRAAGISEAGLNCAWLLAYVLGDDRLSLLADGARPVPPRAAGNFKKLLARKARGEPLAYILGWQPFCGLSLKVDRRVLVPRPETEELVGLAADFILKNHKNGAPEILDFGAGSGAIALALAFRFPKASVTAAEKSKDALACAKENAAAHGLESRVRFLRAASLKGAKGLFDVIVSNPPYIPTTVIPGLDKEALSEPFLALDGGADGLKVVRPIIRQAPEALKKGGALFLELGDAQAPQAFKLFNGRFWREKKLFSDLNGKKRFMRAVKK
ncbi:MAG: peptide chain release factor N(5)-glutamine methyltransferase [Elusimicrobia bacterium]|nr:peptide chain release factor N(5)-glutamine methyltransferase [Elusimicrobiota bacterium]